MAVALLMIQMKTDTLTRTSVINPRVAARKSQISTRLATRRGVSTSPAMAAVSNKFKRSRSRKLKLAPHWVKGATLTREDRLLPQVNQSRQRGHASLDQAISLTRCRPTSTITTCPTKRSRSSDLSKLRNVIWSSSPATAITLASR